MKERFKFWPRLLLLCAFAVLCLLPLPAEAAGEDGWYWLSSNDKYSNFFDPDSVVVTASVSTPRGQVATEIEAYIKTGYSYAGAKETIESYGIGDVIPDPSRLVESVARIKVNPQNRLVSYAQEDFYDADGRVLWSHANGREKEINSQSFEEKYYTAIVDRVFHQGEEARAAADNRWHDLFKFQADGLTTTGIFDTTTARLKGENLIFWEWDTTKDAQGNTLEIKFLKRAVNLPQGTVNTETGRYWSGQTGWQDMGDELAGGYRAIKHGTPEADALNVLRAYAKGYSTWVTRYSIN